MSETALEKVQAALSVDVVVAAQEMARTLDGFDPAHMSEADDTSLVDRGTVIAKALKKLTDDRLEIHRSFDDLKTRTTAKLTEIINVLIAAKSQATELWQRRQMFKREAAERQGNEARLAATAAAEAAAEGSPSAPAPPPAEVPAEAVKNTTTGAIGKATGRKNPAKFKVLDWETVAKHYPHLLVLNEALARVELRALLVRDPNARIAGTEHWFPESVSFGAR